MGAPVICPSCSASNDDARSFCHACGSELRPTTQPVVTAGRMDDVQQVELARIPTVMHAPTAWTIAKGVFLGLLLWSVFSALVAFTFFAVALRSTSDDIAPPIGDLSTTDEPTSGPSGSVPCTCDE